jgi:hypothetical protein
MNKAVDTEFRVIRLPKALRNSIKVARDLANQTNLEFVANAVDKNLPKLVNDLRRLGFTVNRGELRPTRLPFSVQKGTLKSLGKASASIGIPAVHLLAVCLANSATKMKNNSFRRKQKS